MMELISRGMVSIALIVLLLLTDIKLAIIVGFTIGGAYGLIFYFTNNYLKRIGGERLKNNKLRFMAISEAFGAIKEVKVGGLEQTYIEQFSKPARNFAIYQSSSAVLALIPRFFLEAIAFGGIMLMILYLMIETGSFNKALPVISLYVFAGYRLIPALQQIYVSFNQLSYVNASLDFLYNDLKSLKHSQVNENQNKLLLKHSITLKQIYYNYPNNLQFYYKKY
jgi:ABC-type bacteriocin/lantibiotic exporter with double-glycine peptidase domain